MTQKTPCTETKPQNPIKNRPRSKAPHTASPHCQPKKNNTPRTRVFFVKHDHLVESYSYIIIISNLNVYCVAPFVVMFHWSIATEINNDIIADMTRPDCVIRVVLATSKLSIGIDMASIKYNNPPWSAYDKRGLSAGHRSGW